MNLHNATKGLIPFYICSASFQCTALAEASIIVRHSMVVHFEFAWSGSEDSTKIILKYSNGKSDIHGAQYHSQPFSRDPLPTVQLATACYVKVFVWWPFCVKDITARRTIPMRCGAKEVLIEINTIDWNRTAQIKSRARLHTEEREKITNYNIKNEWIPSGNAVSLTIFMVRGVCLLRFCQNTYG